MLNAVTTEQLLFFKVYLLAFPAAEQDVATVMRHFSINADVCLTLKKTSACI